MGHEGPDRESRYSSTLSLHCALDGRQWFNATPRPLYPRERDPVPIVQEAVWAPGPIWTDTENLAPNVIFFLVFSCTLFVLQPYLFLCLPVLHFVSSLLTTQTSMSPAGFEPAILASDRPQTLALNRAATELGYHQDSIHGPSSPWRVVVPTELPRPTLHY